MPKQTCPTQWRTFHGLGRFSAADRRLRPDHRPHLLPPPRPSLAAANLCLAGLRSVPGLPGPPGLPRILAEEARRAAALGDGRPFAVDPTGRAARGRRGVSAALSVQHAEDGDWPSIGWRCGRLGY